MNATLLEQMKNVDIRTVNPKDLVDIRDVNIKPGQTKDERIMDFVEQIKNPYCYKVGNIVVKVSFANGGATLEDRLQSLFIKL